MFSISFVIPCYNAEKFINKNLLKLKNKLLSLNINYEIILIDDGSHDSTSDIISIFKKKNRFIKLIRNSKNEGKSFSLIKGIKKSKYQNIVIIDCDLPYFSSLNKIISHLKKKVDLVFVNRKLKGSKLKEKNLNIYQMIRYILGAIIAYLNRIFLNINFEGGDTQAGLKGFKKNYIFKKNKFISKKFFFDLELINLYLKNNLNVISIKTLYKIPKKSSIKIFDLKNNYFILKELILIWILKNPSN